MNRSRAAISGSALLFSLNVLACSGETRVSLLDPIVDGKPDAAPDAAPDAGPAPAPAASHLIHRYSFSGDGPQVSDSVGGADGTLEKGAVFDGAGHVVLDGKDDFVDLPNGLISGLSSTTLIAWLSWNGGPCWQRVFDFGSSDAGEGVVGNATSSVFATPLHCPDPAGPTTAFETTEGILGSVDGSTKFPVLVNTSLAVVVDPESQALRLYVAGKLIGTGAFTALSAISDVNDWLGRSQWVQDVALRASLDEFRIYDLALDSDTVAAVDAAGPDAPIP